MPINKQLDSMKPNMSTADRGIRILLAALFATLYFIGVIPGTLGLILTIVGGVFLLTSFVNFCPLYAALGIRTGRAK